MFDHGIGIDMVKPRGGAHKDPAGAIAEGDINGVVRQTGSVIDV